MGLIASLLDHSNVEQITELLQHVGEYIIYTLHCHALV